jgi:hypothetical protein
LNAFRRKKEIKRDFFLPLCIPKQILRVAFCEHQRNRQTNNSQQDISESTDRREKRIHGKNKQARLKLTSGLDESPQQ